MHLHTGRAASQLNHALSTMVPRDGRGSSEFWNQVGRLQFAASLFDSIQQKHVQMVVTVMACTFTNCNVLP